MAREIDTGTLSRWGDDICAFLQMEACGHLAGWPVYNHSREMHAHRPHWLWINRAERFISRGDDFVIVRDDGRYVSPIRRKVWPLNRQLKLQRFHLDLETSGLEGARAQCNHDLVEWYEKRAARLEKEIANLEHLQAEQTDPDEEFWLW